MGVDIMIGPRGIESDNPAEKVESVNVGDKRTAFAGKRTAFGYKCNWNLMNWAGWRYFPQAGGFSDARFCKFEEVVSIDQSDVDFIKKCLDDFREKHPGVVSEYRRDEEEMTLAYLEWYEDWMRWSVNECTDPVVYHW